MKAALLGVAAALAGLALVGASCPNQCSGHGYCDSNDRCLCYKTPGLKGLYRDAWTGADCSLRMCAFGDSHDVVADSTQELQAINYDFKNSLGANVAFQPAGVAALPRLQMFLNGGFLMKRDIGVEVRVVKVDASTQTLRFQTRLGGTGIYSAEVEASLSKYTDRARAYHVLSGTANTGLYMYFAVTAADLGFPLAGTQTVFAGDLYYSNVTYNQGKVAFVTDQNTMHPALECSGRGACDRAKGECACFTGWTGDTCQRTVCPNDCSGHGTCQSLSYFVQDGSAGALAYVGVDASQQMGCKCDVGFRGYDCSQTECPSGVDPLGGSGGAEGADCSGRGTCDYSTGSCHCFKGYSGDRCDKQNTFI